MMPAKELKALADDIAANGLNQPIVIYNGRILDGRNRARACEMAGVAVDTVEWDDPGCGPVAWVVSQNVRRRHLTATQRATLAVDLLPELEAEALQRKAAGGRGGLNQDVEKIPHLPESRSRDRAAELVQVNERYVSDAKKVAAESPELLGQMRAGEISLTDAKRQIKADKQAKERKENEAKVELAAGSSRLVELRGIFSTIVIDPPWSPDDEGDVNQFGRTQPTYKTLTIGEIEQLPIRKIAAPDCHIYLWITNRSLEKGFRLLRAWDFRYITCLTWVKPSIGVGNYFRNSTEHILFGVRGSLPLLAKDLPTAFQAPRPGRHSAKPDEFYELAEKASPSPRIDYFARRTRDGWTTFGEDGLTAA